MTTLLTVLIVMLAAAMTSAEEFMLFDPATGQDLGPFTYLDGSTVSLDGRTYTLTRVQTAAAAIEERLKQIIVPSIEFREARLSDILRFLSEASHNGRDEPCVNFVSLGLLSTTDIPSAPAEQPFDEFWDGHDGYPRQPATAEPLVTLSLRRISLYDALVIICQVADLSFRINERGVIFITPQGKTIQFMPPASQTRQPEKETHHAR